MHDLFASWERAGAGDLSDFTDNWLRTAGPDTDRARPGGRRRCAVRPRPTTPPTAPHSVRAAVAPGVGDRPTACSITSRPRDAVRRRRTTRSCSTPTRTPGRWLRPGRRPGSRCCRRSAARSRRPDAARRRLEQRPQRASTTRGVDPGRRARRRRRRPADRATTAVDYAGARTMRVGARARSCPLRRRPGAPPSARCTSAAWRRLRPPHPGSHGPARGLPGRDRHGVDAPLRPRWLAGDDLPEGIHARPRPALAGARPARRPGRGRPRRARTGSSTPSPPPRRGSSTPARGLAARRRGQGVGLGLLHRRGRRAQLRAPGGRPRHVARPARSTSPRRTSSATSPTCPTPSQLRSGWVLADAAAGSSRAPRRTRQTLAWPGRLAGDESSTCRCAAGWSMRPTSWSAARGAGAARMTTQRAARAGPDPGPDPGARARGRRRPAPRGPAGHRGAAGDPAGLAGRPARRVWVTMRTPGTTSSSRRAGWSTRALVAAPARSPGRLLHRRRPRPGAGVQRRDRDRWRAAHRVDPGAPPRGPRRRVVGVRGLRQGQHRRGARRSGAAARWTGPRARRPTSSARSRTGCARSRRSSTRTGGVHAAGAGRPPTGSCSSSARTSAGTTPSTR